MNWKIIEKYEVEKRQIKYQLIDIGYLITENAYGNW
jgi:hypothetical protein